MCRLTTQSYSWQNKHCRDRLIVYLDTALIVFSSQYKPHAFGLFKNGPIVHKSWIRNNHKRTRCGTQIWQKILTPSWILVRVQLESRPTCGPSLRLTIHSNEGIQVIVIVICQVLMTLYHKKLLKSHLKNMTRGITKTWITLSFLMAQLSNFEHM